MAKLVHLNTDILLYMLNLNFSLQELFHLRGLCRQLRSLIESRHCIGARKSLKIFWQFDDLLVYIKKLYMGNLENDAELRLKNRSDDDLILNRLFSHRNPITNSRETIPIGLHRVLPNLERLRLSYYTHKRYPRKVLRKLGPACTELHIRNIYGLPQIKSLYRALSQTLAPKSLTHLTIHGNLKLFGQIIDHFTELRSLHLQYLFPSPDRILITEMFPLLVNQVHLIELHLYRFELDSLGDPSLVLSLPQLGTVQHLKLCAFTSEIERCTYAVLFSALCHTFPSVQTIGLKLTGPEEVAPVGTEPNHDDGITLHLAQFGQLVRFELYVYSCIGCHFPHLLSVKHRVRYDLKSNGMGKSRQVRQMEPHHQGRQIWKCKTIEANVEESERRVWTKCDATVWG